MPFISRPRDRFTQQTRPFKAHRGQVTPVLINKEESLQGLLQTRTHTHIGKCWNTRGHFMTLSGISWGTTSQTSWVYYIVIWCITWQADSRDWHFNRLQQKTPQAPLHCKRVLSSKHKHPASFSLISASWSTTISCKGRSVPSDKTENDNNNKTVLQFHHTSPYHSLGRTDINVLSSVISPRQQVHLGDKADG